VVAAIHRFTDTWHDLLGIVLYQEIMDRNCHHAKFSIPVSAASVILEILRILGRGFHCSCARHFLYAVHVLHLLMGGNQSQEFCTPAQIFCKVNMMAGIYSIVTLISATLSPRVLPTTTVQTGG
jgi:hypothetical protein